jgi:hypothetical protein
MTNTIPDMTEVEAAVIAGNSIVAFVWLNAPLIDTNGFSLNREEVPGNEEEAAINDGVFKRASGATMTEQFNSPDQLKVISQSVSQVLAGALNNYVFDPTFRNRMQLYIIDNGFNLNHEVCPPFGRGLVLFRETDLNRTLPPTRRSDNLSPLRTVVLPLAILETIKRTLLLPTGQVLHQWLLAKFLVC